MTEQQKKRNTGNPDSHILVCLSSSTSNAKVIHAARLL